MYIRSNVNHLLPLIAMTGGLHETWTTMRGIIFQHVLDKATLPKEAAGLMGMNFYHRIIRPIIRTVERDTRTRGNVKRKAFIEWLRVEENYTAEIRGAIVKVAEGKSLYQEAEWNERMKNENTIRLLRARNVRDEMSSMLTTLDQPNLILMVSNAMVHEFEERIYNIIDLEDEARKNQGIMRATDISVRISATVKFKHDIHEREVNLNQREDVCTKVEKYILYEATIANELEKIEEDIRIDTEQIIKEAIEEAEFNNCGMLGKGPLLCIRKVHELARRKVAESPKKQRKELELMTEIIRTKHQELKALIQKRKPDRQKTNEKQDAKAKKLEGNKVR